MTAKCLINGEALSEITTLDRGLNYGDGLFETIAVVNRKLLCWDEHAKRLEIGCNKLNIAPVDKKVLEKEALSLVDTDKKMIIKIIITRGTGNRGYKIPENIKPTRIISVSPWAKHANKLPRSGITLRVCEYRYAKNSRLAGIKHLNRLEQVIARSEWNDNEIAEGIVMDTDNFIIEGTMSNLFCLSKKKLYTPDLTYSGIDGVVRSKIIALAEDLNLDIEVKNITLDSLLSMEEIFMCNSIIGIWPVKEIDGKKFTTHNVTNNIIEILEKHNYIPVL